jgi:D-beta-D-heptose 7-phosphate kinase/D-beta-D-heptose 1-phosphate adenosyltransferase
MKTVFIAGVFDCFHYGHFNILDRAKKLGDKLIVGLNTDIDITRRKGKGRPIDNLMVRTNNLYQTKLVDYIIPFEGSPIDIILNWEPDVIVVGDDYTKETTVGYPECLAWDGDVVILPRTPNISTTDLIKKKSPESYNFDINEAFKNR